WLTPDGCHGVLFETDHSTLMTCPVAAPSTLLAYARPTRFDEPGQRTLGCRAAASSGARHVPAILYASQVFS
ncbi:MAG: hypothetical protein ACR2OL_15760, partial [Anderseniella sp.]